jgi:IS5 family transposase
MIDTGFTVAPRQRNTREENKSIKNGEGNNLWNDKPNKKKHKGIDARWTKKNGETFYGYKNHAKVDTKSKFINTYTLTDASIHDSQALDDILTEKDKEQDLHTDSAYKGEDQDKIIENMK